jgi:hypothetical protein
MIRSDGQNIINNNIYTLFESILLMVYFLNAGLFRSKQIFYFVLALFAGFWIAENFILKNINTGCTYFRIFSSLIITAMSIESFNNILAGYVPRLLRNADFLLCTCFLIYFTYKALIQAFIIYGASRIQFFAAIYTIFIYINLGVNLLYIPAVLWMHRKARFILPLS